LIKPGYYADLVLLDPNSVSDKATLEQSNALSTGVEMVWVNGQPVFEKQKATGFYPGMLIRKKS
jgi:N-acyl-D-aspartate/D-glutamate deacylase